MKRILDFLGFKKEFWVDNIRIRTNFVPQFELDDKNIKEAKRIVKILSPIIRKWYLVAGGVSFTRFNEQYHLTLRLSDMELDGSTIPKDIQEDILSDFEYYFNIKEEKVTGYFELNSTSEYIIITIVL
jgi:hypothetical protein